MRKSVSKMHLRLVTDDTVAYEMVMREYYRSEAAAKREVHGFVQHCQGSVWAWDLPSGSAMKGGFQLRCEIPVGHKGYCRDATEIEFLADRPRLDGGATPGKVVHWSGYGDEEILDLEKMLSEGWG